MLYEDTERAAEHRRTMYRTRGDRPQQRRGNQPTGQRAAATIPAQLAFERATGAAEGCWFTGVASSVNSPYEMFDSAGPYNEIIAPGAFANSLSLGRALDVPLVIQHDQARRLARTTIPIGQLGHMSLAETSVGLECRAQLDPDDPDVQYVTRKIRSGLMTEMSFAFQIDEGAWSEDYTEFTIRSVNLQRGDVSVVGFGANPSTVATIRSATDDERTARELYDQLHARFAAKPAPVRRFLVRDEDLR